MNTPDSTVELYANNTVMSSNLPAPLPRSAMPGATSPMMSNGMNIPRKLLKMELNVRNTRTAHPGKKNEQPMPRAMAMSILGRMPSFFIKLKVES